MDHYPIQRRDALKLLAGICACATPGGAGVFASQADARPTSVRYVSAARTLEGVDCGVLLDDNARLIRQISLPGRAHGAAGHEGMGKGCLFARRPGMYMLAFDLDSRRESDQTVEAIEGRHFYGHGAYSNSGRYLYATENDYERARGVLGVYDVGAGYRRVAEVDVQGTGPHDVIRVPNADLLVVANGGIRTHPDHGRDKLNIDSMQPSIVLIDSVRGVIVGRHQLGDELHQLSLRHLACSDTGQIWFAGQYEGDSASIKAVAGSVSVEQSLQSFQRGHSSRGLQLLELPESLQTRTQHYLTSVAVAGRQVIFSAAKGGVVFSVDMHTRDITNSVSIVDCSGVASHSPSTDHLARSRRINGLPDDNLSLDDFLVSSGTGQITRMRASEPASSSLYQLQWDNHLYRL